MAIVRRPLKVLLFAASLPLMSCGAGPTSRGQSQPTEEYAIVWQPGNWTVLWQDELEGMAGTPARTSPPAAVGSGTIRSS